LAECRFVSGILFSARCRNARFSPAVIFSRQCFKYSSHELSLLTPKSDRITWIRCLFFYINFFPGSPPSDFRQESHPTPPPPPPPPPPPLPPLGTHPNEWTIGLLEDSRSSLFQNPFSPFLVFSDSPIVNPPPFFFIKTRRRRTLKYLESPVPLNLLPPPPNFLPFSGGFPPFAGLLDR